jgi:cell division protease FtsH
MSDEEAIPTDDERFDEFFQLFRRLMSAAARTVPRQPSALRQRVDEHLGTDSSTLPIVEQSLRSWDHINLQFAIDALLEEPGVDGELLGITAQHKRHMDVSLSDLLQSEGPMGGFRIGPVDYVNLASGPAQSRACVGFGLWLFSTPDGPFVALMHTNNHGHSPGVVFEVMGRDATSIDALHARIRNLMLEHNVFRGQVLSLGSSEEMFGPTGYVIRFHDRVSLPREAVVMAPGTLERIERHTVDMAAMREALRASRRHLKRGVLLHGPPGTGKTLTTRYLVGRLADHTVVLLTGSGLHMVGAAVEVARALQPAVVVLEDCDLVAQERTFPGEHNPVLFELLNAMDGVADDADLLFVLTTNRADLLEPALAARPGRVDLAIEIPLPDDDCRRRLLDRYLVDVEAQILQPETIVARTEGVTASFMRELVRAATVRALDGGTGVPVNDRHFEAALDELLDESNVLTARLLGAAADRPPPSTFDSMSWMPGARGAMRAMHRSGFTSVMHSFTNEELAEDVDE